MNSSRINTNSNDIKIKECQFNMKKLEPYLYILPAMIVIIFVVAFPVLYNIYISMFEWNLSSQNKPFIGLENYITIVQKKEFLRVIINTFLWTGVGVFSQMVIGLLVATFVEETKKLQGLLRSLSLLPWITPGIVACLIWSWMLQADIGIINNLLMYTKIIEVPILWLASEKFALFSCIVVNTWKSFPFWFLMILAGLQNLPQDQVESAWIDGASRWNIFTKIKIPHLLPIISVTGVLTTIWTLNYPDLIYILTKGGPNKASAILPFYTYETGFMYYRFGESSAVSIISLIMIILISSPYIRMTLKNMKEGGAN